MKQGSIISIITIVILLIAGGVWVWQRNAKPDGVTPTLPTPVEPLEPTEPTEATTPQEPDSVQVPEGWKTYTNEEFGFAFDYPGEWGNLTVNSNKDDVYYLTGEEELVKNIIYHKISNTIAFIKIGQEYEGFIEGIKGRQEKIIIIYPDKKIKTIYAIPEESVKGYALIKDMDFSPTAEYLNVSLQGYEYTNPLILNTNSGLNILNNYNIWYGDFSPNIFWFLKDKVLVIKSYLNEFDGRGEGGLFISDYGKPEKLNKIISFSSEEVAAGSFIENLKLIEDKIIFSVIYKRDGERRIQYEYLLKLKQLRELAD